ncbi:AfsR/SARP family transcriptional regulator, partial [Actinomadura darangshiensis]
PGEAVQAGRLAEASGGGEGHALQSQVSRLRSVLRSVLGPVIERSDGGYRILVEPADVDACRFERLADEGRAALRAGDARRAAALLREALGLWRGPALADLGGGEGIRLDERRLAALEDRIEAELRLGGEVVPELRELVGRHPLRERLAALYIRALRDGGRRAEALAAFEETRRRLADELGTDPSSELTTLHEELLRADVLAAAGPPAQLTSFVGRDGDVAGVAELLDASRLVTLVGPGGVGKTRLAVEVAGRVHGDVCFVELAPLRDAAVLPQTLLGALGLRESRLGGLAIERLIAALSGRTLLLVLDNCEHLVDAVASLAGRLLAACPDLRVLATSRESLTITGEALWPVRPLEGGAAGRLFTDRAAAVRRDFAAGPEVVQRICDALDNLPLAIELAAARLRTMDIADLASRLDDRLGIPTRGSRTADERHRTLRAVVAWSWDLLDDAERRTAGRFTVFAGGAPVTSARQVCGGEVLESLVDKSLLDLSDGRYRMLETVRAYGAERLDAADDVRRVHARHFLELAQAADPHLRRAEQLEWLPVLAAEHDNLLVALRWAVEAKDVEVALRLFASMSNYLWVRGLTGSVAAQAAKLLDVIEAPPDGLGEEYVTCVLLAASDTWQRYRDAAQAVLTTTPGRYPFVRFLWLMRNVDGPGARDAYALVTAHRNGPDPWARAAARFVAGFPELADGDTAAAGREFGASVREFRALGDRWGTSMALDALAGLAHQDGDDARAIELTDEALALTERLGALEDSADLLVNRGDYQAGSDAARADYERAAGLARRAGSPTYLAAALRGLGDIALRAGDLDEAERLYSDALGRFDAHWVKSAGNRVGALIGLGRIAAARGDRDVAKHRYRQAIESAAMIGALAEAARGVEALAESSDENERRGLLDAAAALRGVACPTTRADALRLAGLPEAAIAAVIAR